MKKVISMLMILTIFVSFMVPVTYGAENSPTVELQYVIREGQATMQGITDLTYASDRYMIFRKQDSRGIMDINGKILAEGPFAAVEFVGGDLFAVERNDRFALYRGGKALTDYKYKKIEKGYSLVRGLCSDGTIDHFDFNGEVTAVPKAPEEKYQIYDYIPEKCIMLRYVSSVTDGTILNYSYKMATPEGKVLNNTTSYSPIEQITDGLFKIDAWSYCYYNLEGQRAFGNEVSGGEVFPAPDKSTFILHYKDGEKSIFRLYDRWANYLFDIEAMNLDRATNLVVNYIDDNKILYKKAAQEYVVIDTEGNVLQTIQGEQIAIAKNPEEYGMPSVSATVVPGIGFVMQNGNELRFYRSDLSGSFRVPGYSRVYVKQKIILSYYSDNSEALYDLTGKEICHGEGKNSAYPAGNYYGVKKNGSVQIYTLDGRFVADRGYNTCELSGNPQVALARCDARGGFFLVDSNGVELNDKAFEAWNDDQSENVIFKRNGGYGIARIYSGEGNRFLDVPQDAWYREGAEFCAENGLFNGTEAGRFSPEKNMTRAMLVTVLWRLEGEPTAIGNSTFSDVADGTWYTSAVQWATENGIVNGVGNGRFNPNGNVTREQIATILCRYATIKGRDTNKTADLSTFSDASRISGYAMEALMWANAEGLISGVKSGNTVTLQPKGEATRAQVATILMRYIQN